MASLWLIGAIFVAVSAVLVTLVAVTNRSIARTVGGDPAYAANVADAIASGDLTVAIRTRDGDTSSLLHVMQRMRDALTGTICQIKHASDNVACGANEIANGNADLSSRTEKPGGIVAGNGVEHGADDGDGPPDGGQRAHRERTCGRRLRLSRTAAAT
jgi:Methyl-accepting chemotaxis protein